MADILSFHMVVIRSFLNRANKQLHGKGRLFVCIAGSMVSVVKFPGKATYLMGKQGLAAVSLEFVSILG